MSVVPELIDALVAAADAALSDVEVYDGLSVPDRAGNFLMIGAEDPDIEGAAFSAEAEQSWAGVGSQASRDEEGDITCAALSWTGDAGNEGQKIARDSVYATANALAALLRTNPSLGVPQVLWTTFGTTQQLMQAQGDGGADALLIFRVHFKARL